MSARTSRKPHATAALTVLLALALPACGGGDEVQPVEGVIDRETFIEVYVDLRAAAVNTPQLTISDEGRD